MSGGEPGLLDQLSGGCPRQVGHHIVIPLLGAGAGVRLELLHLAVQQGTAAVSEVGPRGRRDHVRIVNRGSRPLLSLLGEELSGGMQDRVLTCSQVIPPGASADASVCGLEPDRWGPQLRELRATGRTLPAGMRARLARRVAHNERLGRGSDGDQEATDREARQLLRVTPRYAPTAHAWAGLIQAQKDRPTLPALASMDGQVGGVVLYRGRLLGVERTGRPDLWARLWPVIARGHGMHHPSAWDRPVLSLPQDPDEALAILRQQLAGAEWVSLGTVGGIEDLRFCSERLVGTALVVDGVLAHSAIWPR